MRKYILLSLVFLLLSIANCTRSIVKINPPTSDVSESTPHSSLWSHSFVFGLFNTSIYNSQQICGGEEVVKIENKQTLGTFFVSIITLFLYIPREITFFCNKNNF